MANETEQLLAKLITERDIEDLLARFDDAAIRYDRDAFRNLWMPDGVWEISDPVPLRAQGQDAVVAALDQFHTVNEFFFRSTACSQRICGFIERRWIKSWPLCLRRAFLSSTPRNHGTDVAKGENEPREIRQ